MENINQKTVFAAKWSAITEVIVKLISPITNMILARLLVPEAFGAVAVITLVTSFAEIFQDAGFQKYIVQHEFSEEDELKKNISVAFWSNLAVSILIWILIIIFKNPIASLSGNSSLANAIAISCISLPILAFSSMQMAVYRRNFDYKTLFYVRVITALIPFIITVPLAFWLRNFWALVIGTIAKNLCMAMVFLIKSQYKPKWFFDFKILKEMWSFSLWSLAETITIWFTGNIPIFIVSKMLTQYYLGIFTTAMTTVNQIMSIVIGATTSVLFSSLSRLQNDTDEYKRVFFKFQSFVALFIIPMGIGMYVFRDLVTKIMLGSQWGDATNFIGIFGLCTAFSVIINYYISEIYRSKGKPKISLLAQILYIAVLIPWLYIAAHKGFEILYISLSLSTFAFMIIHFILLKVFIKFPIIKMLVNIAPSTFCSIIMGLVGYFLLQMNQKIYWEILCFLICIIVYFGIMYIFPKQRAELNKYLDIIKRKVKRSK